MGKTPGADVIAFDAVTGESVSEQTIEKVGSKGGQTVGISRGDMRRFFAQGCEEYIQWGKSVHSYEEDGDGVYARFADGSKSERGCLLVAGDGVYSRVAKQVSDGKLKVYDTGARGIHGQAPASAFREFGGEGVFRLADEHSHNEGSLMVITNVRGGVDFDDPKLELGWTMVGSPGTVIAPGDNYALVGETAANLAKELTARWHSKFRPIFEQINMKDAAFWKITCSTSTGVPEWTNNPRVTVLGDAAHSMTPAGGIGANTAVRDSALLGQLVVDAGGCREGLTKEYEEKMRVYASEAVGKSYGMAKQGMKVGPLVKELK